jgi:hypothetical protein
MINADRHLPLGLTAGAVPNDSVAARNSCHGSSQQNSLETQAALNSQLRHVKAACDRRMTLRNQGGVWTLDLWTGGSVITSFCLFAFRVPKGLVEAFQPDYLVEIESGDAASYGIAFPAKRILAIEDLTARDDRGRCKIGTDLRSVCDDRERR